MDANALNTVMANCLGAYSVDEGKGTFRAIRETDELHEFLGSEGSYFDLCDRLIYHPDGYPAAAKDVYRPFSNSGIHSDKPYYWPTSFPSKHGAQSAMFSYYPGTDEKESFVIITDASDDQVSRYMELRKIAEHRSSYLFSMIVDLDDNRCYSVSVPEAYTNDQYLVNTNFSVWRDIVSNALSPDDRTDFRELTDPEQIRRELSFSNSYGFDTKMLNHDGDNVWTRHSIKRIKGDADNHFSFLYAVKTIESEQEQPKGVKNVNIKDIAKRGDRDRTVDLLQKAIADVEKSDQPLSVILVNVRDYEIIRDIYGLDAADDVLRAIAQNLTMRMHRGWTLGRWSDSSIVCICPDLSGEAAYRYAMKAASFGVERIGLGEVQHATLSVGVAVLRRDEGYRSLLRRCFSAAMKAKGDDIGVEYDDGESHQVPPSSTDRILQLVEHEVKSRYWEGLTLKAMGEKYYINSAYLGQIFKRKYGVSFNDYLLQVRIDNAAEMLVNTDKSVSEIMSDVGYQNLSYFGKQFSLLEGMSPTQYRKRKRAKGEK